MKCTKIGWVVVLMLSMMLIGSPPAIAAGNGKADLEQENITELAKMSPEQVKALDMQLAAALRYYYSEEFQKALPLFREIADKVETMDLMFWIGTSAAKTGQYELSVEKYRKMLLIDPELHRVRLELADALYKTGRLREAGRELEIVKAASPPGTVVRKIDQRLRMIGKKARKFQWGFNLSTGYQYDDNISSGPDTSEIVIETGTLRLDKKTQQLEGYNWLTKAGGSIRYDIGEPGGLMWTGRFDFFNSHNTSGHSDINYTSTDISTGPWWVFPRAIVKLPIGYRNTRYGNVDLSDTVHIDPSVEVFLSKTIGIQTLFTHAKESYSGTRYRGNDNSLSKFAIGPNFYLKDRKHILSGYFIYEDRDAEIESLSYNTTALELSYYTRLPTRTDLFFKIKSAEREYDDNPPLFSADRADRRNTFTAAVSQQFLKRYFVSLSYVYMDNDSNADLYSFTKNIITLDAGIVF